MLRFVLLALVANLLTAPSVLAQEAPIRVDITGGKVEQRETPLRIPLNLPKKYAKVEEVALDLKIGGDTKALTGQLAAPGLRSDKITIEESAVRRDLHVV